ncbi:MAG TPA: hypothetical protein DCO89_01485 [Clostridiales bacterium]|nr:hypothetical protein [Clostridiales bacterium]
MTPQIASLIISGLALLIVLFQVMIGAIRGLKKSTFRLIWVFVWGCICVLAATLIAKSIVNIDVSFLHLRVMGEEVSTLPAFVEKMLESGNPDIANMVADNPKIMELCTSIASMFIALVLFEVLFWVTKLLLWPIWAIFSHMFFGKKKQKGESKSGAIIRTPKVKKHAGFGALVGLGLGLIVCMFTFVPLHFINQQVMAIETETATEQTDGTTKGIISEMLGENAKYITVYEDSYVAKTFKYSGIGLAQSFMSDLLTSAKFNGQRIVISKEVSSLAPIYRDYKEIMEYDLQNLSQADIDKILPIVDDAQSRILSSSIVKSVYNELAPYIAKNMVTNPNYFINLPSFDNEFLNTTVKNVVKAFFGIDEHGDIDNTKLVKMEDISADVSKVIDIAERLNETKLIEYVLAGDITFDNVKSQITASLGEDVVDKMFEMKTIATVLDVVVEPSIKYGIESVPSFEYDGENVSINYVALTGGVDIDSVKNFMKSFAVNAIETVKGIDLDSKLYVSGQTLENVGAVIDSVRNSQLISTTTYNSAFNYGVKYASKFVDEEFPNVNPDDPTDTDYKDVYNVIFKTILNSLNDINSNSTFKAEFNKLTNLFNFASTIAESENIETEIKKEENIVEIGRKFDELVANNSLIFSKNNCDTILELLIDQVSFGDYESYKVAIKNNIPQIESFANEIQIAFNLLKTEIDDIDSLETYLTDTLLNPDGSSKSKLISAGVMYDVAIDFVPTIQVVNIDITNDIKTQLATDKANNVSILDVIEQVKSVESKTIDTSASFAEMDANYLTALGREVDNLSVDYNLVLNQTAVNKIGYEVADIINGKVQAETSISVAKRNAVQSICDTKTDKGLYPTFEDLFTAISNVLFD